MTRVLLAITSYNEPFYPDGAKTGLFATEAIHPFEVFKAKGYDVQFVSETGRSGYDEHSLSEDFLKGDDRAVLLDPKSDYNINLKKIKKASDINPSEYEIFFAAGGHGTCFDFADHNDLVNVAEAIYAQGGVIGAVCHGPIIFNSFKDTTTGKPLIEGKEITGFTDEGETQMQLDSVISKLSLPTVEAMAKKLNAKFKAPTGPWDDHSVVDGRVVSGVNPASASSTAKNCILVHNGSGRTI